MELNKKLPALLYLDKNGFYYFQEGLPSVISLAFSEKAIKDMDVISSVELLAQITAFIQQHQLSPSAITIVLSPNIIFEKDSVGVSQEQQDELVKNFLDSIPFESVLSRNYPIEKGVKILAVNEDLYLELKNSFVKNSFIVDSVLPYQMLGVDQALLRSLTTDNASQFLKRIYQLKKNTMLTSEKPKTDTPTSTTPTGQTTETKMPKNKIRLFVMGGVFIVLFSILGFMLVNMK